MKNTFEDETTVRRLVEEISAFIRQFPESSHQAADLIAQISEPGFLYDRKNMLGHVTASAFIVDDERTKVLCITHKALGKVIPPGGHIDQYNGHDGLPSGRWEHPQSAAAREAKEETGVAANYGILPYPIDIDTHAIPARPEKGEGEHRHHDLMYLFYVPETEELTAQVDEVDAAEWKDIASAHEWADERTARILKRLEKKFPHEDD